MLIISCICYAMPRELLYADDLAVTAQSKEELTKKLNIRAKVGMKVNTNKTKVMISGESHKGVHVSVKLGNSTSAYTGCNGSILKYTCHTYL